MIAGRSTLELVRDVLPGYGLAVVELETDTRRRELPLELRVAERLPATAVAEVRCKERRGDDFGAQLELEAFVEVEIWAEDAAIREEIRQLLEPVLE